MAVPRLESRFLDARRSPLMAIARRAPLPVHADAVPLTVLIATAAGAISMSLVGAMGSAMINVVAIPAGFEGLVQSLFFVGALAALLLAKPVCGRLGVRRAGLTAISLGVAAAFLTGMPSLPLLLAGRLLAGVSFAGAMVFCNAILARGYASRHTAFLAVMHTVTAAASALGIVLAEPIARAAGGWGGAFWCMGLLGLIPLVVLATVRLPDLSLIREAAPTTRLQRDTAPLHFTRMLSNQAFLAYLGLLIAYVAAEQAATLFIATFAEKTHGWTPREAALLAALFWAGILLGRLASGFATRFLPCEKQITMGSAVMGAALVMLALTPAGEAATPIAPWVFLAGLAAGPILPRVLTRCAEMVDEKSRPRANLLCHLACCLGGAIGPIVLSLVAENRTLSDGFWLVGGILVSAVALAHRTDDPARAAA